MKFRIVGCKTICFVNVLDCYVVHIDFSGNYFFKKPFHSSTPIYTDDMKNVPESINNTLLDIFSCISIPEPSGEGLFSPYYELKSPDKIKQMDLIFNILKSL